MATVRRINSLEDKAAYSQAWLWMFEQPELYRENAGFDSFDDFCSPPFETIDFAIEEDGVLLAFCSLIRQRKGVCRAALIAPARPRIRPILRALAHLQHSYFTELGYHYLFVSLPDGEQFDRARTIARLAGWREINPNYYEYHLLDHLEANQ